MNKLETELANAQGALEVGLVAIVTPHRPLEETVIRDGEGVDPDYCVHLPSGRLSSTSSACARWKGGVRRYEWGTDTGGRFKASPAPPSRALFTQQ